LQKILEEKIKRKFFIRMLSCIYITDCSIIVILRFRHLHRWYIMHHLEL